jgi:hypothetical protein
MDGVRIGLTSSRRVTFAEKSTGRLTPTSWCRTADELARATARPLG